MPNASGTLQRFRFDQLATQVNDRVDDPAASGVERYVGLEHLDADSLSIRRWGEITDVESTKLRFQPGDIIFGKRRVYQRKLAVADFEGICSAHAMVLRAKPDVVDPGFLPYFMQSDLFMERALSISVGSLSPTINWKELAQQEFALPPIEEQRRMAEVLASARELCERLGELIGALEACRRSVIDSFAASCEELGTMADVIERFEAGSSPPSPGQPASAGQFGVLKVSAVGDWEFVESENKQIDSGAFDPAREVKDGDLLITRANADPNSVGRTCLVYTTRPGLMLSDKTWRAVLNPKVAGIPHAILAWTKSSVVRAHIAERLNGTDAKNISQQNFLSAPAPAVSGEFIALDDRIKSLCRQIESASTRASLARQLRERLLNEELLCGIY